MHKIKILFCLAVLLPAGALTHSLYACGYCYSLPEEYYVYRISENYLRVSEAGPACLPGSDENCLLWMKQLGAGNIGKDEVYEVVYKAELDSLASLAEFNAFAAILTYHPEALKVLRLAKDCEKARFAVTGDPWYYPVGDDSEHQNLEQILLRARECTEPLFRGRYFLQEVRALFTLGRYQEIISRWNEVSPSLDEGVLKQLTYRYVAGSYYNIGEVDKAVEMFIAAGDLLSAVNCRGLQGRSLLDALIEIDVNYPGMRTVLEDEIRSLCFDWSGGPDVQKERLSGIRELCTAALRKNPDDKAVWHYTSAYIDYFTHQYASAKKSVRMAVRTLKGDTVLEGSVRILGILLDAQTSRHGFFYERRLLKDLRWLDGQILSNLTEEVSDRTAEDNGAMIRGNYSYYYWNDMMRALTLGILCPAYLKEGKTTRALQLANMADNRLLKQTGFTDYKYENGYVAERVSFDDFAAREDSWKPFYGNLFFEMADTLAADRVKAYTRRALAPKSALDRFTAERGYCDPDYLNDFVGTKFIRERRYKEALTCLEAVSEDFPARLNTSGYLGTPKVEFARKMVQYEADMRSKDAYEAADAAWMYGLDMMRQYSTDWALSYYSWSSCPSTYVQQTNEEGMELASSLLTRAMDVMPDPDVAAKMQYEMCNYATVVTRYPDSDMAALVRANCDTWEDYHAERPVHWLRYE